MQRKDENHSFNINIAQALNGHIQKAILLKEIYGWCAINKHKGHNQRQGYSWTYMPAKGYQKQFPYMKLASISRWLNELERDGWLFSTDKYNQHGYDRTKWYTINYERYDDAISKTKHAKSQINEWISQIEQSISQNENCIYQNDNSIYQNEVTIPPSTTPTTTTTTTTGGKKGRTPIQNKDSAFKNDKDQPCPSKELSAKKKKEKSCAKKERKAQLRKVWDEAYRAHHGEGYYFSASDDKHLERIAQYLSNKTKPDQPTIALMRKVLDNLKGRRSAVGQMKPAFVAHDIQPIYSEQTQKGTKPVGDLGFYDDMSIDDLIKASQI